MQVNEIDLVLYSFRENMPSHFKFKEYCPMVFRNLRERFGIDDQDFQVSSFSKHLKWWCIQILKVSNAAVVNKQASVMK